MAKSLVHDTCLAIPAKSFFGAWNLFARYYHVMYNHKHISNLMEHGPYAMVIRLCIQETYILVNYFKIISELTLALHFEMRSEKPLKLDFKGGVADLPEII
jgi:hypothetical protein